MTTSQRRSTISPPLTRHFEVTRLQNQSIALAYQALIPIVSRPLNQPRSQLRDTEPATTTFRGPRSKAGGACPAMSTHDLRVGFYARVSGEKQAKEDTIASQIEAVLKR